LREADVAIRVTPPTQPDLIRRSLMTIHFHVYGSTEYLKKHGIPKTAKDLDKHRLIVFGDEFRPQLPVSQWLLTADADGETRYDEADLRAPVALAFGAVFGREIFGGRAILPPALIALAFAIFSFPEAGFEVREILGGSADFPFALSCLPGAAILAWRGALAWPVAAGAAVGAAAAAGLWMGESSWWEQLGLGGFAAGVLFLAAAHESAVSGTGARWLHGAVVGILVIAIRFANPDEPDGVVFAALLGGLFAPLLDRAVGRWCRRA